MTISNFLAMPIFYVADEQMKNIKAILLCLKAISSPMIIFFQSELIGFKTQIDHLLQLVDIMGCKAGFLLALYLGLTLFASQCQPFETQR